MLTDKNIVIGVTGGIAAYKACDLVSKFKKMGANVDVIMTKSATKFIGLATMQTLSQNPVITDLFESPRYWDIEHISLAQKADILLVVPATANIIGKVASGIADDMLSTTIMASTGKVIFAPAMNTVMYNNKICQENILKLSQLGYRFIGPASGKLACGDMGLGRLAEVDDIVEAIISLAGPKRDFQGRKFLITAGPTQEAIDPVRFISNHSSGKMGYALARAARDRGGVVTLVTGPTSLPSPSNIDIVHIISAQEMYDAVLAHYEDNDIIIKAAAVSDYRPQTMAGKKIKKQDEDLNLNLVRNPDILLKLGQKKDDKILLGFAAETNDLIENAKKKIKKKNLDLIVANDITQEGAGFQSDTNIVYIIDRNDNIKALEKMDKFETANHILDQLSAYITK